MYRCLSYALAGLLLASAPAVSQNFTTAAEVRPILDLQKAGWASLRAWEGNDLVYFTALLAWRCGLTSIHYGVNGGPANIALPMEPCHEGTATPNALTQVEAFLPYVTFPGGFIRDVSVLVTFDDGTSAMSTMPAQSIRQP